VTGLARRLAAEDAEFAERTTSSQLIAGDMN
jgi:hypothetical protein